MVSTGDSGFSTLRRIHTLWQVPQESRMEALFDVRAHLAQRNFLRGVTAPGVEFLYCLTALVLKSYDHRLFCWRGFDQAYFLISSALKLDPNPLRYEPSSELLIEQIVEV